MSRMCREKGAVKHDDRVDAMAQGVQWFIDALAQSAHKAQAMRKNEEWNAMVAAFENNPHLATDALVLGKSFRLSHLAQTVSTTGFRLLGPCKQGKWCSLVWICGEIGGTLLTKLRRGAPFLYSYTQHQYKLNHG